MKKILLTCFVVAFVCSSLHAQTDSQVKRAHYLGLSYSATMSAYSGDSWLTYYYTLQSVPVSGYGLDYVFQNKLVGFHGQLRLSPYKYLYVRRSDPRTTMSNNNTFKYEYNYSVVMLSVEPMITFTTQADGIKGIGEVGMEINGNVYGKTTSTRTWDRNLRVQFVCRAGLIFPLNDCWYLTTILRFRCLGGYNYIPTEEGVGGFSVTGNVGLLFRLRSRINN